MSVWLSAHHAHILGLAAAIGVGACYGAYTVAAKAMTTTGVDLTAVAGVTLPLGCLPALPWMAATAPAALHPKQLLLVLWLGVITCATAYGCFMRGMTETSAPTAGTLSLAEPLAAVTISVTLLQETLGVAQIVGCALVILGLTVAAARRRTVQTRSRPSAVL